MKIINLSNETQEEIEQLSPKEHKKKDKKGIEAPKNENIKNIRPLRVSVLIQSSVAGRYMAAKNRSPKNKGPVIILLIIPMMLKNFLNPIKE